MVVLDTTVVTMRCHREGDLVENLRRGKPGYLELELDDVDLAALDRIEYHDDHAG
jgi:hypothetical protein